MIPFLITIDTEGDNLWALPSVITARNARFLPRFQALCERFSLKPTYLTNYEMAIDTAFVEFGQDALARKTAEIGMHLHAWYSPPDYKLTVDDNACCPYLIEYPEPIMRAKIGYMTKLLEDTFSAPMRSHRAGRWAFNATYASMLKEFGYVADCSVTPHIDWRPTKGNPAGQGGIDYRAFPTRYYWLDNDNVGIEGRSGLLEVPVTITNRAPAVMLRALYRRRANPGRLDRIAQKIWPARWLRPNGSNLASMLDILNLAVAEGWPYVEFMIHSSEFMPEGSPNFVTTEAVEGLYRDLEVLFTHATGRFNGMTLNEFHSSVSQNAK